MPILSEGYVYSLVVDTCTVLEGDQEVFEYGGVEALHERGETGTYGTMQDSPRGTVYRRFAS